MKDMILSLLTRISPELNTRFLYKKRLGKKIDLKEPKTFNEKIQWLKLNVYPKNKKISMCADKYLVRKYIKDIGCE